MEYLLKDQRGSDAHAIDADDATRILRRLRFHGRKLVEIFVLDEAGEIECYQERTRRKLGSNAIASRTWLCEGLEGNEWGDGHYVQEPREAIEEMDPPAQAVVLVLHGGEASEEVVSQLQGLAVTN